LSVIPDIPRLYTAVAEWAACLVYIIILEKRFSGYKLYLTLGGSLGCLCILQTINGLLPLPFWMPGMVAAVALMYLTILTSCDLSVWDAGVLCARSFVLAEFAASFEWQVYRYFAIQGYESKWTAIFLVVLFYAIIFSVLFFLENRHMTKKKNFGITRREFFSSVLIAMGVFFMSNLSFIYKNTPFSGGLEEGILYIRTLVDFAGLVMLYAQQDKWHELHMKQELEAINRILLQQYEQYQLSRDNIDLLNQKYHDLKHQINVIRTETDPEKKEVYLEEMETGIKMYEAQNKTGNSVLDTILTSKSMYCIQKKINFTCVADGTLLSFMEVMDICTIFGNVMDNAIESVEKLADVDLRLIRAAVFVQNDFLMIRVENYCETELDMVDGVPVTTKRDKLFHGYGIKSIRYTVEKYEGTVTIRNENNWFTLRILIPIQGKQQKNSRKTADK